MKKMKRQHLHTSIFFVANQLMFVDFLHHADFVNKFLHIVLMHSEFSLNNLIHHMQNNNLNLSKIRKISN